MLVLEIAIYCSFKNFYLFLPLCKPCLACCLPFLVASLFFLLAAASFLLPEAVDFNLFICALGAMSLLTELLYEKNFSTILISVVTVLMAFLCYVIIPSTNSATDEGNQKKFKKLQMM